MSQINSPDIGVDSSETIEVVLDKKDKLNQGIFRHPKLPMYLSFVPIYENPSLPPTHLEAFLFISDGNDRQIENTIELSDLGFDNNKKEDREFLANPDFFTEIFTKYYPKFLGLTSIPHDRNEVMEKIFPDIAEKRREDDERFRKENGL